MRDEPRHDAWRAFVAEVRARGLDAPATGAVLGELAVHTALLVGSLAGYVALLASPLRFLLLPLALLGMLGITSNTHTSVHGATLRSRAASTALGLFGFSFVATYSLIGWRVKHMQHHRHANVAQLDPDHEFLPYFALSEEQLERGPLRLRRFYGWQWLVFPFAIAAMGSRMRVVALRYMWRAAQEGGRRARAAALDAAVLFASLIVWVVIPFAALPALDAIALQLLRTVALSYGLFAMFAPAHLPARAPHLRRQDPNADPMLAQIAVTVDYRCPRVFSFFLSGLDYQIEHHVMPGLAHVRYRQIAPLLEAFCEARGWPRRVIPWGRALRETWATVRRPKPAIEDLGAWLADTRALNRRAQDDVLS